MSTESASPVDATLVGEAGLNKKPSWDEYYLGIADAASRRSSCARSKVGAAVVKDNRVRSLGYNDAAAGKPGCGSCPRRLSDVASGDGQYDSGPGKCVAIHAEANALLYCDREDLIGATLYITREPCAGCSKLIEAAGITDVIYPDGATYHGANMQPDVQPWLVSSVLKDGTVVTDEVSYEEYVNLVWGNGSKTKESDADRVLKQVSDIARVVDSLFEQRNQVQ